MCIFNILITLAAAASLYSSTNVGLESPPLGGESCDDELAEDSVCVCIPPTSMHAAGALRGAASGTRQYFCTRCNSGGGFFGNINWNRCNVGGGFFGDMIQTEVRPCLWGENKSNV